MKTKLTMLTDVACPWCRRRARAKQRRRVVLQVLLSVYVFCTPYSGVSFQRPCWETATVQVASLRRRRTDGKEKFVRCNNGNCSTTQSCADRGRNFYESKRPETSLGFHVKDLIDMAKMILTKTGFSNAIMIMDKIDGWHVEGFEGVDRHDGSQVGGRVAACMWIFSKTVILSRSKAHGHFLGPEMILLCKRTIGFAQDNHDSVSEFSQVLDEQKFLGELNF